MKKYTTTAEELAILKTRGNYYRNWEKYQVDIQNGREEALIWLCKRWDDFLYSDGKERDLDEMMSVFAYHSRSEFVTDNKDFFEMMRELAKLYSYANLHEKIRAYVVVACECNSTGLSSDEDKDIEKIEEFVSNTEMRDYLRNNTSDNLYKLSPKTGLGEYIQTILFNTSSQLITVDCLVREWVKKQTKAVKNAKVA